MTVVCVFSKLNAPWRPHLGSFAHPRRPSYLSAAVLSAATIADIFSVTATSTSKDVLAALAAARKKAKPYTLGFSTTTTAEKGRERGEKKQGEVSAKSQKDDGSGESAAGAGIEQQPENEARNSALENREGKDSEGHESSPVVAGNGGAGKQVVEGGGEEEAKGDPQEEPAVENGNGEVTLMYEMYDEKFSIKVSNLTQKYVPTAWCVTFEDSLSSGTLGRSIRHWHWPKPLCVRDGVTIVVPRAFVHGGTPTHQRAVD